MIAYALIDWTQLSSRLSFSLSFSNYNNGLDGCLECMRSNKLSFMNEKRAYSFPRENFPRVGAVDYVIDKWVAFHCKQ